MSLLRVGALCASLFVVGCHAQQSATPSPVAPSSDSTLSSDAQNRVVEEIRQTFNVPPDVQITVGAQGSSDFAGYSNIPITFTRNGRVTTVPFLLSKDQKTLVRMERYDLTKVKLPEETAKEFLSKQPALIQGRPERGNPNAPVTIVNFDDFQCPFCSRMHQELFPGIFDQYKDKIKVVYVDFPLSIHPWAMHAAVDANCLGSLNNDAYWDFADRVHASQQSIGASHDVATAQGEVDKISREIAGKHNVSVSKLDACIAKNDKAPIEKTLEAGETFGVNSTPTMFINGTKIEGALPENVVKEAIDKALKQSSGQAASK